MGGSLLKDKGATRITTEKYNDVYVPALTELLDKIGIRFEFVRFYHEKPDHGNINILINRSTVINKVDTVVSLNPNRKEVVCKYLTEQGYPLYRNQDVVSFLFDGCLQVDLIFTATKSFAYATNYFAWNDLGGLVGRLSRGLGLKHGHQGLYYVQYNEDKTEKLGEHLLTLDYDVTLDILGLDVKRFHQGFNNLEEIYEFIVKSPYFGTRAFILEDLPCKNRHRDSKRNTFIGFEEYIQANTKRLPEACGILPKDKEAFILQLFPHIQQDVDACKQAYKERKEIAAKFNGNIIMEMYPELTGKDLGGFIGKFKNKYDKDYLLNASPEQIVADIRNFKEGGEWLVPS